MKITLFYFTLVIFMSYLLEGAFTVTVSHFFLPFNAEPIGDSSDIVHSRTFTSPVPTIV